MTEQVMKDEHEAGSGVPAHHLDLLGVAKHLAVEFAKVMDAKDAVDRRMVTESYKSGFKQLDPLGNLTVDLKDTTRTVILQKQGGNLDGLHVTLGELTWTYPANSIPYDVICLPTYSLKLTLNGTAGDSYNVIECAIENLILSAALK